MTAAGSDAWSRLAELPLTIESYEFERLSRRFSYGHERVTTRVRLRGGGVDGLGEDVSPLRHRDDHAARRSARCSPLAGEWTLESFCDHLAPSTSGRCAAQWDMMERWRNWAFESAALDLALAPGRAGRCTSCSAGSPRRCAS